MEQWREAGLTAVRQAVRVGLMILGLAMLMFAVLLRAWVARRLESQGHPSREAWRTLPYSATLWMGLILVVCAVSPVAAGALVVVVLFTAGVLIVWLVARGVRDVPSICRRLRSIGDPNAWR